MKYLFLNSCICLTIVAQAQYPEGNVILSTQQEVIEFSKNYPDCIEIPGNIMIGTPYGRTDIHDLSTLVHVQSIGGYLNILNNPELTKLSGLENIDKIGGRLNIYNNDGLMNLDALVSLSGIKGSLWIINNENLTSIAGLKNVSTIDGSLDLHFNTSLTSLHGLENIDPTSIKRTLDYTLARMIDVRTIGCEALSDQDLSHFTSTFQSNRDPVYYFHQMPGKPYHEREVITDFMYREMEYMVDSAKAHQILEEVSAIANSSGEPDLQWEARLLREYYHLKQGTEPMEVRLSEMKEFADLAGRKGQHIIQARAFKYISFIYWLEFPDYEKLFKTYHELEQLINTFSPSEFPDMAQCYMIMGRAHYYFRNYENAIHYFRKGVAVPIIPFNTTYVMHSRNNLGLCYQKLHQLDSSDLYFQQILQDSTEYPIEIWKGIAAGNLGQNYYLSKEYEKAIPLLQRDIQTAEANNDWGLAAGSLTPLAEIRIRQGQLQEAEEHIRRAREYIVVSRQEDRLRLLYPVISKYHAAMGHENLAADYVDSTQQATKEYNDKFNALKLLRARQELNAHELQLQESQKQKLRQQRNLVIAIVFLVFASGLIFWWYRNRDVRRRIEIRELALKHSQESLKHSQARLGDLTRKIRENNQLIDKLKANSQIYSDSSLLNELQNVSILTNDDWSEFKNHFQSVYPGFLETIETRHPELSPAEVRYLCLLKLGLSTHEMASAQGVSPKSINVTTHRIRKKLDLENQEMLEEMVIRI